MSQLPRKNCTCTNSTYIYWLLPPCHILTTHCNGGTHIGCSTQYCILPLRFLICNNSLIHAKIWTCFTWRPADQMRRCRTNSRPMRQAAQTSHL